MDKQTIMELFSAIASGHITPEAAYGRLKIMPFEDLGYAKVDHHRAVRQGASEVIFGQGKTPEQISGIARSLMNNGAEGILITRLDEQTTQVLDPELQAEYHSTARIAIIGNKPARKQTGSVVIASGGTSDIPVCEEAALTAEFLGSKVTRLYDVGVAGIHRLLSHLPLIAEARVIVAVAGMEGALPSVLGGLADSPVIAVPTSIGYGASFGGLSALLTMLNSCASGISVVNIDNGFGAGYLANMINKMKGATE